MDTLSYIICKSLYPWRGRSSAEYEQSAILHPPRYLEELETFAFDPNTDTASVFGEHCLDTSERYGNVSDVWFDQKLSEIGRSCEKHCHWSTRSSHVHVSG
ncbi:hypothetical protein TNIN_121311 [Trichonephila inaurata madagascariensis]|uniref:Uncharacterized protein n=1 Tax=Trichonephila inaurata madagascariensis TaxID=2747483 RepID=A0A8X6K0Q9_9ARAC|nr:hypothetical protein TNIN_349991 [Trichonephila inaurata madagascariensis]GFY38503.1 hypothetical protein TNIN_121311 [Trichonephila inaurata madagascariensis]